MLVDLHVENFALLDRLDLSFTPGLTVLTGETGAGKSIVVDAINVLLGERASADVVRTGAEKAVVQGVFDVADLPQINVQLESQGFEPDDYLYISREITTQGRNQCRINGRIAQVGTLREITQLLADVHGQHEHQLLLSPRWQLSYLDGFAGQECIQIREAYSEIWEALQSSRTELGLLDTDEREKSRLQDLYRFQIAEIDKAELKAGEQEELNVELSRLANLGKLFDAGQAAHDLLHGSETAPGSVALAQQASRELQAVASFDPRASTIAAQLSEGLIALEEAADEVRQWRDLLEMAPDRLDEVQARLSLIDSLRRKYGETIAEVLSYRDQTARVLHDLEFSDERKAELQAQIEQLTSNATELAANLTSIRSKASEVLADRVQAELRTLGMPDARLEVTIEPSEMGATGADSVSFMFSANAGEPPRPLARVASGGELSRAMLALKGVLISDDPVRTLVFDEIDSGVGGRTATWVGEKLQMLAKGRQALCVTHLAQIARFADSHILVSKHSVDDRTFINAAPLEPDERVGELARMLGGDMESEAAIRHARELLSAG